LTGVFGEVFKYLREVFVTTLLFKHTVQNSFQKCFRCLTSAIKLNLFLGLHFSALMALLNFNILLFHSA